MVVRSLSTSVGPLHGLTPNLYAAAGSSAVLDLANFKEGLISISLLSVVAATGEIKIQDSDDSSSWTDIGTIEVAIGTYNATLYARFRECDVRRYVRARFEPGGGGTITGGIQLMGFWPNAENPLEPVYTFDSANI
jgi:hypothetical protein